MGTVVSVLLIVLVVVLVAAAGAWSLRTVPHQHEEIVERFGRYKRTLRPGLNFVIPGIERVRSTMDLREQVIDILPQPVITKDNVTVHIDIVIYLHITSSYDATYAIADYRAGVEQLVATTLRNIAGGMDLEHILVSRDRVNSTLRDVLDDVTGRWGLRVSRIEIQAIEPPPDVKEAMQRQVRAELHKRAAVLVAEGEKRATVLRAEGEAEAIGKVFGAIHEGDPDQQLLAYQYLQALPKIARGDANKLWIVPSEISKALEGIAGYFGTAAGDHHGPVSAGREAREGEGPDSGGSDGLRAA